MRQPHFQIRIQNKRNQNLNYIPRTRLHDTVSSSHPGIHKKINKKMKENLKSAFSTKLRVYVHVVVYRRSIEKNLREVPYTPKLTNR